MIKKLLIVFVSGLLIALVALSSAWVLGGDEATKRIANGENIGIYLSDDDDKKPDVTRTFPFEDIKVLTLSLPVSLEYTRGDNAEMIVSGPDRLMKRLSWEDGRLSLGGRSMNFSNNDIKVTITAPMLPDLVVKGAGDADLNGLDQPALSIDASGALDLNGSGKVKAIKIDAKGASDIDLSEVTAEDADVRIAGAGDVDVNASGKVDASIAGAGQITLHTKPSQLTSQIKGAGTVEHDY